MQKLKLSKETVDIIKNFSNINKSILFRPGNILRVMAETKNIIAKATITETFETEFAIYDVARFVSVLSLFNDPELEISENFLTIKEDKRKLDYTFADPLNILAAKNSDLSVPNPITTFKMLNSQYKDLDRARSVLKLPEFIISGDGTQIKLLAGDVIKKHNKDQYSVVMGESDIKFRTILLADNLRHLPLDYSVTVSDIMIQLKSESEAYNVEYFVAAEPAR